MNTRHEGLYKAMQHAVLEIEGQAALDLRRGVAARAAALSTGAKSPDELPPAVSAYTEKIALHAYKILDSDIERLASEGHSEDAIFELTLAAALGAASARYERAAAVLDVLGEQTQEGAAPCA